MSSYSIRTAAGSFLKKGLDSTVFCKSKKWLRIAKAILKQKSKVGECTSPNFKTYCKASETKTMWDSYKDRHINKWTRRESSETDANKHGPLIFAENTKISQ